MSASAQRHRRGNRCPICDGADGDVRGQGKRCHGATSPDGEYVFCTREEHAGAIEQNAAGSFAHRMHGLCRCGLTHGPERSTKTTGAIYVYENEHGIPSYRVVRTMRAGKKSFYQESPDGAGGWLKGRNGARRVLYRLPQLLRADPARRVRIVEGEKDVESLEVIGEIATCNPEGAEKWSGVALHAAEVLAGRDVDVIADADAVGRRHALLVAAALSEAARSVRLLECPAPHKDVSDLLAAGGTLDQLVPMSETEKSEPAPKSETSFRCTELGNSLRLVQRFGDQIRHCTGRGWYVWTGKAWKADTTGAIVRKAKLVVADLWREAAACEDESRRNALRDHAKKSEKASAIAAMIKLSESADGVAIETSAFDADPWVLNCRNGILDLRTRTLRPHDPAAMCTKIAAVDFDPGARCSVWERFVAEVLPDADVRGFLQRWAGYQLTGVTRERAMLLLIGRGRNGKSVLVRVLVSLMGDYAQYSAPDVLMEQSKAGPRHPTELADLCGVRFAALSETKKGRRFDEETLKRLTGDEPVKARFMGRDFFQFDMQAKLVMAANHRPRVVDATDSIWDRLKEIPFTVRVDREREDKRLFEKLRAELPGVLRWAVEGCADWQRAGLGEPSAVTNATAAYRSSEDPFLAFFLERVVFGSTDDRSCFVSRKDLREAYAAWCESSERRPGSASDLLEAMLAKGCEEAKVKGERFWRGARLRTIHDGAHDDRKTAGAAPPENGGRRPEKTGQGARGAEGAPDPGSSLHTNPHEDLMGFAAPRAPRAPQDDFEGGYDEEFGDGEHRFSDLIGGVQ